MRCGNWGKEPFDLRLTILRMIRRLPWLLAVIVTLTLALGGGYYLKNVTFRGADPYTAYAVFLIDYADANWAENLKYVNEYSWNVWMQSDTLQDMVKMRLPESLASKMELGEMLKATVPSDLRVVQIHVTDPDPATADMVLEAVKEAMTGDFPPVMEDIAAIRVTKTQEAVKDVPDVRPVRAFALAAVISILFTVVAFLVRELTLERIWLPTTLTDIYGLKDAGLYADNGFEENLQYFLQNKKKIAVIPANDPENAKNYDLKSISKFISAVGDLKGLSDKAFVEMPCPLRSPECVSKLREADGTVLIVKAGTDSKNLGLLLHFLGQQDVKVDAAVLWEADNWLVRAYYRLGGKKKDSQIQD